MGMISDVYGIFFVNGNVYLLGGGGVLKFLELYKLNSKKLLIFKVRKNWEIIFRG